MGVHVIVSVAAAAAVCGDERQSRAHTDARVHVYGHAHTQASVRTGTGGSTGTAAHRREHTALTHTGTERDRERHTLPLVRTRVQANTHPLMHDHIAIHSCGCGSPGEGASHRREATGARTAVQSVKVVQTLPGTSAAAVRRERPALAAVYEQLSPNDERRVVCAARANIHKPESGGTASHAATVSSGQQR